MSKFTDKLQRIYRDTAPSMGFRRSAPEAGDSPLLIIANLAKAGVREAEVIAGSGIDAGIVSGESLDARSFERLVAAMGDVPLGLFLEEANQGEIDKLVDLGCDFVVFGLKMPLTAVKKEGIGKILKIEPSLDHGLARVINELQLPVDGVLITGEESSITIERLLICQRFVELLDRPLLVTLGSSATSDELGSLCEAGVSGLVLPEGLPAEAFAEMRKTVGSLPQIAKRRAKGAALLPQLRSELETEMEEDEEI